MADKKDKKNKEDVIVATKSRDVVESYIFSTSKRSLSVYSERLLMQLVSTAQAQIAGVNFRDGVDIGQVSMGPLGEISVEIPIKSLLGTDGSTNYSQAKDAIMELMKNPYFVERPKIRGGKPVLNAKGEQEYEFIGNQILNNCQVNVKPGVAVLKVNDETWNAILDFSKGFRRYDLEAASSLKKSCSLRLFRLLSNQKYPITYTIQQLREMWNMEDKYENTNNFIRRTIDAAKQELDESAPWSFDYVKNYAASSEINKGRKGKKAITSITFIPVQKVNNLSTTAVMNAAQVTPAELLGLELYQTLTRKFGFTNAGLKNNLVLFHTAKDVGVDLATFLTDIAPKALRATNPQGYTVRALTKHLEEKYGTVLTGNQFIQSPLAAKTMKPKATRTSVLKDDADASSPDEQ